MNIQTNKLMGWVWGGGRKGGGLGTGVGGGKWTNIQTNGRTDACEILDGVKKKEKKGGKKKSKN